jgi:hypothetical protein
MHALIAPPEDFTLHVLSAPAAGVQAVVAYAGAAHPTTTHAIVVVVVDVDVVVGIVVVVDVVVG